MSSQNSLHPARTALCFLLSLGLWACSQSATPAAEQQLDTTEAGMPLSQRNLTTLASIPPIDAAVPDIIETATFGLG